MERNSAMLQDAQVTEEQEELLQLQVGLAKCVDTSEIASWSDPEFRIMTYEIEAAGFDKRAVQLESDGDKNAAAKNLKVAGGLRKAACVLRERIKGAKAMKGIIQALDETDDVLTSMEQTQKEQAQLMQEGFTALESVVRENAAKIKQLVPLVLSAVDARLSFKDSAASVSSS